MSERATLSTAAAALPRQRRWWQRLFANRVAMIALTGLLVIVILAIIAPLLPLPPPNTPNARLRLSIPGENGFVLGSDTLGRSILSRIIWGGQISLGVAMLASGTAMLLGLPTGLVAGYYGGRVDDILMRLTDVFMAFPIVLLAITIIAALGTGLSNAMLAAGIAGYPLYARVVRGSVLTVREMEYVVAARAIGASNPRIMLRHLLPNVLAPLIVTFTLDVGNMIILTSSLSFLGLGTQPPNSDWGNMIAAGRTHIRTAPHLVLMPGTAVFLVVLALNIAGDALRDALDPRLRN